MIHCLDRGCSKPIWAVWHQALDERIDAISLIIKHRSYSFDKLYHDVLICPLNVSIIESWWVNQCHITSCLDIHTRSDRIKTLFAGKMWSMRTWIAKIVCKNLCNFRKYCWFPLTTFTEDASCELISDIFLDFPFFKSIDFRRGYSSQHFIVGKIWCCWKFLVYYCPFDWLLKN